MLRAICLSLLCFGLALDRTTAAETAPEVAVSQAVLREVTDYADFIGRAEAMQSVTLCPRVSGQLLKICFKAGGAVRQGDLLFEIDPRPYQADLEKAQAEVQLAVARLKRAAVELERQKKLSAAAAVDQQELDRKEADRTESEAALQAARARLDAARVELEFTKVQAPISGKIGLPAVDVGNIVTADTTPLATLVSTGSVHVSFDIDERTALQLRRKAPEGQGKATGNAGLPVACGLVDETGYPRHGDMEAMNNRIDPATGALRMRAVLPNSDGLDPPRHVGPRPPDHERALQGRPGARSRYHEHPGQQAGIGRYAGQCD